jgi:sulfate adenylyltransferase subunit 1 (EFTu-like GTPase family)
MQEPRTQRSTGEEILDLIHKALGTRIVFVAIGFIDLFKFPQEFFLAIRKPYWRLDYDVTH